MEIIDVDPDSMQCVCVAVVQVQATVVTSSTKKVSNDENYSYSALQRLLYTGGFKFCWDLNSGQYYVSRKAKMVAKWSLETNLSIFR